VPRVPRIPNYKNSYPIYNVPKLGGQHAAYLVVALKAYASRSARTPPCIRSATMSEQDMQDIAATSRARSSSPRARRSAPRRRLRRPASRARHRRRGHPAGVPESRRPARDYIVPRSKPTAVASEERGDGGMAARSPTPTSRNWPLLLEPAPALCSTNEIATAASARPLRPGQSSPDAGRRVTPAFLFSGGDAHAKRPEREYRAPRMTPSHATNGPIAQPQGNGVYLIDTLYLRPARASHSSWTAAARHS